MGEVHAIENQGTDPFAGFSIYISVRLIQKEDIFTIDRRCFSIHSIVADEAVRPDAHLENGQSIHIC